METGKLAPKGWHVPTDAEWTELTDYLAANGHTGTEGTALKSKSGWNDHWDGTNGTDDYGWEGIPGGFRTSNGDFNLIGYHGYWWSSSQFSTYDAWLRFLSFNYDNVYRVSISKKNGLSVRCLRD